jgi:hypothetical protein
LGYSLYKAFVAGLVVDPMDVKWSNLLTGCEYTDNTGQLHKWRGLISVAPASINATPEANRIDYVAIQGDVDSQTIPVPAVLVDREWKISKRPIGPLRVDEYDSSGEFVSFTTPITLGDTYFFYSNDLSLAQSVGDVKESLIANYVYYWYLRMTASNTTPLGETVSKAENSDINGPAAKTCRAWNEMSDIIGELIFFFDNNRAVYTEWNYRQRYEVLRDYGHITRF